MDTRLGTAADYVDLRFVKSRKVCQIVLEIPIEQAAAFVAAFGVPDPSTGVPVALARLQAQVSERNRPASTDRRAERKAWGDLLPAQQAAIRCADPDFQTFLRNIFDLREPVDTAKAAEIVRAKCHVASRGDLNTSGPHLDIWRDLDDRFYRHQRGMR